MQTINLQEVRDLDDASLDQVAEWVKQEKARRGVSLVTPGREVRVEIYGGQCLCEVKRMAGTKVHVIIREILTPSRSARVGIGRVWIIPPSALKAA